VGSLPFSKDGLRVALAARDESHRVLSRSSLRLLEGGSGTILTGESLPFLYQPYIGVEAQSFVAAEIGFEASASIFGDSGDEKVRLDLRPFSGRFGGGGGLRYTAASTSLTIEPGETVVLGEISRAESSRSTDLTGVSASRARENRVLLVSVEIANR
jgi:hypothetical protein